MLVQHTPRLTRNCPKTRELLSDPGTLSELFRAVEQERPELPQVQASIEILERLYAKHVTEGVQRWPVPVPRLPELFSDCLRVIRRLEPESEPRSNPWKRQSHAWRGHADLERIAR